MTCWMGLQVRTLGDFEISFEGRPLKLNMKETSKPMQLLQLLLYANESGVSRRVVVESLFGEETETDAAKSLNVAVSRLRRLLRESGLPEQSYIRVQADRYFFQCDFPLWVDTQEVDHLRKTADLLSAADRTGLLYRLCDMYRGRFLPELDGEMWVEVIRARYQRIYRTSMEEICRGLKQKHAYAELLRLTSIAAQVFPFDEWQVWQQESLLALGRTWEAQELYRQVEELYLTEIDAPPPEHMYTSFQRNIEKWREADSVETIRKKLAQQSKSGGYILPLSQFMNACYMLQHVRGAEYCCLLCTLTGDETDSMQLYQAMRHLEEIFLPELKGGDLLTWYSMRQFLILLLSTEGAGVEQLFQKVEQKFYETRANKKWKLDWQTI